MNAVEPASRGRVIVSSLSSDAHTWNLVYLQLLLEELGFEVVNLGPCVPDELLIDSCLRLRPSMVVISSVNGHGFTDGQRLITRLRAREELADVVTVIGGMLGTGEEDGDDGAARLVKAGFDAVFVDGAVDDFRALVHALRRELEPGERTDERI